MGQRKSCQIVGMVDLQRSQCLTSVQTRTIYLRHDKLENVDGQIQKLQSNLARHWSCLKFTHLAE